MYRTLHPNLKFTLKTLLRNRTYQAAILTLALSIGISTAVFSLARAVIFHALPFPNQAQLRVIWKADPRANVPFLELAYPELRDLLQNVPALQSAALMPTTLYGYGKVIRIEGIRPFQVETAPVSHDFFTTLGTLPLLGRAFRSTDDRPGAAPVVILSHNLWRTRFGSDPAILGRHIPLNGEPHRIIGVTAPEFDFPKGAALWTPLGLHGDLDDRSAYYLQAIARLKPDFSDDRLNAQLRTLFTRLAHNYAQFYSTTQQPVVTPLTAYWLGSSRTQLLIALAASLLLLVTGCITAGNLFLSRTLARRQEIATRASVGASTAQIFTQFLTEGLAAATLAGLTGLALAYALTKLLVAIAPNDIPRLHDATLNWQVLCFASALSILAALACSLPPTFIATRRNLETVLRERGPRLQLGFTLAQTATSVILLVASVLIVISVRAMLRTDTGFANLDAVTMNLAVRGPHSSSAQRNRLYTDLLHRLHNSPLVTDAGAVLVRPLEGSIGWDMNYRPQYDTASEDEGPISNFEVITPGYFATVGTALLEGRGFTASDSELSENVVIVSSGLAQRIRSSGHEPLGTRIELGRHHEVGWWKIIGITAATRYRGVTTRDEDIYVNYLQTGIPVNYLVIHGHATPAQLTALVRTELAKLDPTQAIANVATLAQLVERDTARQRFNMLLLSIFGAASLLLTAAGIYSVIAESIALRTRDIAIRLALGSDRLALVRTLTANVLRFVLLGELTGLAAALLLGRTLSELLYSIQPHNPAVLASALTFILLLSITAAVVPAWRASSSNIFLL